MLLHQTLPYIIFRIAKDNQDQRALSFKNSQGHREEWTYQELLDHVCALSLSLLDIGLSRGNRIFMFLDNCKEWAVMDISAMSLGVVTIPRGSDSSSEEIQRLVEHMEPQAFFIAGEKEYLLLESLDLLFGRTIISVQKYERTSSKDLEENFFFLEDLLVAGKNLPGDKEEFLLSEIQKGAPSDIVTISCTSGTTGTPKGACLTHKTFTFQLEAVLRRIRLRYKKEVILSILPIWHAYERIIFYLALYSGAVIVYSKPIPKVFLEDIQETDPSVVPAVPRLFESIYGGVFRQLEQKNFLLRAIFYFFYGGTNVYFDLLNFRENRVFFRIKIPIFFKLFVDIFASFAIFAIWPIQALGYWLLFRKAAKRFGKNLRFLVSGGAHLPLHVDKFFRNIGLHIVEGYGMTEMGPLITFREFPNEKIGSVGQILDGIEYYLKDLSGERNPKKGELFIRSPQMMVGYYDNKAATEEVIMEDGFLRTGDIAEFDVEGAVRIVGRVKNLIVLASGENIEVEPLEEAFRENPYIAHSLLVGQDEKFLGALIVPNFELLEANAKKIGIVWKEPRELCKDEKIREFYRIFIKDKINHRKEFLRTPIVDFHLISKEFSIHKELTSTLKVKRLYVEMLYQKEIESLYHRR